MEIGNRTPNIERFFEHINRDGPKIIETPCWIWTGNLNPGGYGTLMIYDADQKVTVQAHRFSYFLAHPDFPQELHVLHRCDNKPCLRPTHLFTGTAWDNRRDCVKKDRQMRGVRHYAAKLTPAQVMEIRRRKIAGEGQAHLAREFKVNQITIWRACSGKAWKSLPDLSGETSTV